MFTDPKEKREKDNTTHQNNEILTFPDVLVFPEEWISTSLGLSTLTPGSSMLNNNPEERYGDFYQYSRWKF